jgi:GT2 family glycosyltransferase
MELYAWPSRLWLQMPPSTTSPLPPSASVVILNFNGVRFLDPCLEALRKQEVEGGFEVLLVDNASTDDSVAHIRKYHPWVQLVESTVNLGFAGGNNLGIRKARGRYLVLLNNDTKVRPGWLRALVAAADADDKVGAVGAKLLFIDPPGTIQNAGVLMLDDGSGGDRGFREPDTGQYDRREEVFGACGASVLYRREMLRDVGDFDETFFMYYEDTDLSWRMRLAGWKVLYEPAAVVDHVHAGSGGEWSPFFTFHVDRNRLFMILKNAPSSMVLRTFSSFALISVKNALRTLSGRVGRTPAVLAKSNLGSGRARIHINVVASLIAHIPEMLVKRYRVRRLRRVPDAEVTRWFYSRKQWDAR